MICPRCRREIGEPAAFCPYDGERLAATPSEQPSFSGRSNLDGQRTHMTGAIIGGRYQIRAFLRKGATARVYVAEDLPTREQVIVKLYAPDESHDPDARGRFLREAELLRTLVHPNLIRVLGFGEMQGRPYVVTEPLRGETLAEYLHRHGSMPAELAITMMRHAALGLSAAHQAGIVHRDVKPGNLFLVGPPGSPYGLKVIDFGLARRQGSKRVSDYGAVLGTVQYMAPEQIVADPTDARTDVYGLGTVMFRAFTGHLPFVVDSEIELFAHQLFSPAPPPSWLSEELDRVLDEIVLRCLRKRPENRYPSMDALVFDLGRVIGLVNDRAVSAAPVPVDDDYRPVTQAGRAAADVLRARFSTTPPSGDFGA